MFLRHVKVDILNTRAFKQSDGTILITVGSIQESTQEHQFENKKFIVQFGEFKEYLKEVNYYLQRALQYVANENQREMVTNYIKHYETGSIEVHKES